LFAANVYQQDELRGGNNVELSPLHKVGRPEAFRGTPTSRRASFSWRRLPAGILPRRCLAFAVVFEGAPPFVFKVVSFFVTQVARRCVPAALGCKCSSGVPTLFVGRPEAFRGTAILAVRLS